MSLDLDAVYAFETECARCLAPIDRTLTLSVRKSVAQEGTILSEEDEDEYLLLEGTKLPLDDLLAQTLFLELPYAPLCRQDCKGLCPSCGKNLNEGDCGCSRTRTDPRLKVLADLLRDGGGEES